MKTRLSAIFLLFIAIVLFGVVGRIDLQDEEARSEMYCKNVASNVWPDYKRNYKVACKAYSN